MSNRSKSVFILAVFCLAIALAAAAPPVVAQEGAYAEQSLFYRYAKTIAEFDVSIEKCQDKREGYRSRYESLVSVAHPEYRTEAMSHYDSTHAAVKKFTDATGGPLGYHPCVILDTHKMQVERLFAELGPEPSGASQTGDASETMNPSDEQESDESLQRIIAALEMCPGANAKLKGDTLFWEFDPPDEARGVNGSYESYADLKRELTTREASLKLREIAHVFADRHHSALLFLTLRCTGDTPYCIPGKRYVNGETQDMSMHSIAIPLCNGKQEFRTDNDVAQQLFKDIGRWAESVGSNARVDHPQ